MDRLLALLNRERGLRIRLARELGITHGAVSQWFTRGQVPATHVVAVERITGIPRHALRPDVFPAPHHEVAA